MSASSPWNQICWYFKDLTTINRPSRNLVIPAAIYDQLRKLIVGHWSGHNLLLEKMFLLTFKVLNFRSESCWNICNFLFQNASAQAALQAAQALSGSSDTQGGPNTVLRVIIEHMLYPITLDVLHQVRLADFTAVFHIFTSTISRPGVRFTRMAEFSNCIRFTNKIW